MSNRCSTRGGSVWMEDCRRPQHQEHNTPNSARRGRHPVHPTSSGSRNSSRPRARPSHPDRWWPRIVQPDAHSLIACLLAVSSSSGPSPSSWSSSSSCTRGGVSRPGPGHAPPRFCPRTRGPALSVPTRPGVSRFRTRRICLDLSGSGLIWQIRTDRGGRLHPGGCACSVLRAVAGGIRLHVCLIVTAR